MFFKDLHDEYIANILNYVGNYYQVMSLASTKDPKIFLLELGGSRNSGYIHRAFVEERKEKE